MEVGDRLYDPRSRADKTWVYIYCLIDPRDWSVFYVGQSVSPHDRYYFHARGKSSPEVENHCLALREAGVFPVLEILAKCQPSQANDMELSFVATAAFAREPLANQNLIAKAEKNFGLFLRKRKNRSCSKTYRAVNIAVVG